MDKDNQSFLKVLLATFKEEAEEHLKTLTTGLVELEMEGVSVDRSEVLESIYRAAHSLKGAARAVDLTEIETLCHSAENAFSALKSDQLTPSAKLFDVLHHLVDTIGHLIAHLEKPLKEEEKVAATVLSDEVTLAIQKGKSQKTVEIEEPSKLPALTPNSAAEEIGQQGPVSIQRTAPPSSSTRSLKRILGHTVRIEKSQLDALLLEMEELLSLKLAATQRTQDIKKIFSTVVALKKNMSKIKPAKKQIQQALEKKSHTNYTRETDPFLLKLIEYLTLETEFLKGFEGELGNLLKAAEQDERELTSKVNSLLEGMKKILMEPLSVMLQFIPKVVRDISREQNKEVDVVVRGAEREIDRRILEEMYDPIIHLVRNSIDHGIETKKLRESVNKSPRGTITLDVKEKDGTHIEILVSDDGAGIDIEKIRDKAIQQGILSKDPKKTHLKQEILPLIFQSGISTSETITNLSGRGLGLAIAWEKTDKLGGRIDVESESGVGTTFHIILPLTLATFRGVYVHFEEKRFLVPTTHVVQCLRVPRSSIKSVEHQDTIYWREETLALVSLADVLNLPISGGETNRADTLSVLILESSNRRMAFSVDKIVSEEEVLVKTFHQQLSQDRSVAGATILGNGDIVPILNVAELFRLATTTKSISKPARVPSQSSEIQEKSIMVVEDSITSRTLLKNILETAGYQVCTAVDGVEAFTQLKNNPVDLVVSDVDMPNMNGFELTQKIRADKAYDDLAVILVTSLESPEDRERGIDSGADAYLVKSRFDQSNLLEIVRRLI